MFWYLLLAALVNAGLGYAVAVAITRSWLVRAPVAGTPARRRAFGWPERVDAVHASAVAPAPASPPAPEEAIGEPPAVSMPLAAPVREEVPRAWLQMLDEGLETDSFVEAAAHVVRLDVTRYREDLLRIDAALREEGDQIASPVLDTLEADLLRTNQDWLARQSEAAAHLQSRRESSGSGDEAAAALEAALMDQAAHIQDVCRAISQRDTGATAGCVRLRLLSEIGGLLDHCHSLRDRTHDSLVAVLRREGRLAALKPALHIDSLTLLKSRAAIEMLLENWWRDDPSRHRLASIALFDVDRLSDINRRYGPRVGDRLIGALAVLARDGFRRNRGYDVVGRFSGQQFFVFLGDTGPQGATTAVERLRQTVQAASVSHNGEEIDIRLSCAVAEILPTDNAATLLRRAQDALQAAKTAGGNVTLVHDGARPASIQPPTFSVVLHTLRLDADPA